MNETLYTNYKTEAGQPAQSQELPDSIFIGFSERERRFLKRKISALGFLTSAIRRVVKKKLEGQAKGMFDDSGTLSLDPSVFSIGKVNLSRAIVHEALHSQCPFSPFRFGNQFGWKTYEAGLLRIYIDRVLKQCIETKIFLNGYHKHLCEQFNLGNRDYASLLRETWAILLEKRFADQFLKIEKVELAMRMMRNEVSEYSLQDIEKRQELKLKAESKSHIFTPLTGKGDGATRILLFLTSFRSETELDRHISRYMNA